MQVSQCRKPGAGGVCAVPGSHTQVVSLGECCRGATVYAAGPVLPESAECFCFTCCRVGECAE